ncbi:Carboxy-terminal processing protease CtpA [Calidithermus terrae]|uniref:Carboxy-terminal processing protease CtpA n=1 Tax=Calidithermus terrae TaxID=1408545 RepID=A0A399ERV7_9DEIN|nr:S41 family peptidase [Calidithermus terrae]RIH86236.1 Carboxy-terminal processing protease CtpA [Calidithermus terrae]
MTQPGAFAPRARGGGVTLRHALRLWLWGLVLVVSAAWASPAQDLFDQAMNLLITRYAGISATPPSALQPKYQARLSELCQGQADCPYDKAVAVLGELVGELADAHTRYLSPERLREVQRVFQGAESERPGLGASLRAVEGLEGLLVLEVFDQSPAQQAGLRRGDRVVAVNRQPLPAANAERAAFLEARVAEGGPLVLEVLRAGARLELTLTPQRFSLRQLPSLSLLEDGVAVLRIPSFATPGTGRRVHTLVGDALERGARAVIVDLRDNSGGSAQECQSAAGAFVGETYRKFQSASSTVEWSFRNGVWYSREGGQERARFLFEPVRWQGPVVVIVNGRSASCAEYFAFDLQDAGYPVVGEPTRGVANTSTGFFLLPNGGGLQISVSRALRADGSLYPDRLTPNVLVPDDLKALAEGRDVLMERALEQLRVPAHVGRRGVAVVYS